MRKVLALALLASVTLAGCATPDDTDGPRDGDAAHAVEAPWWPVGAWWDVEFARDGAAPRAVRLVNFWNDSATSHFWIGVADRDDALDHALHDTNPFLGRIHWNILTPHESGIHATGMYAFPTEPGDTFGGLMFGRQWEVRTEAGDAPGKLEFRGEATDGATVAYDYDPANQWFSYLRIEDESGAPLLTLEVSAHGTGATGAYWFLRGRDYHEGPTVGGTHDETFEVKTEEIPPKSLAVEFDGTVTGPLRIDLVDPAGAVRHTETSTGGPLRKVVEIPSPATGTWTARFVGTGALDGTWEAVGILEYTRTI